MVEAMARPLGQWHPERSGAPRQSSFPGFKQDLDEQRVPRLSTPPNAPLRLPQPQPAPSYFPRRNSVHSNHASTPSPLERHSPGHTSFGDAHHMAGARSDSYYDYRSPSSQLSPAVPGRFDISPSHFARTAQQMGLPTAGAGHYVRVGTPQLADMTKKQPNDYFPKPPTPRLSQSPQQSQTANPLGPEMPSPRQESRKNMAVHALLNDDAPSSKSVGKSPAQTVRPDVAKYELSLRQQPVNARSCGFGDRDRRVVDPPPIIQLKIHGPGLPREELNQEMRSPLNIIHCSIWSENGAEEMSGMPDEYTRQKRLMGNLVASPFVGVDEHGKEGCFFCFPDISCRTPGRYRLKFSLVALKPWPPGAKSPVKVEVLSDVFQTYSAKEFPGMSESTPLAKALKAQGCNIPTKKGNEAGKGAKRDESDDFSDDDDAHRNKRVRNHQ